MCTGTMCANSQDAGVRPKTRMRRVCPGKRGMSVTMCSYCTSAHRTLPRGPIKVSSSGHTVAMKDPRLPNATKWNHFGAADHELPEWTPVRLIVYVCTFASSSAQYRLTVCTWRTCTDALLLGLVTSDGVLMVCVPGHNCPFHKDLGLRAGLPRSNYGSIL